MKNYEDGILLKIYREYSKDESFNFLIKRLKETEMQLGIIKSEYIELKDEFNKLKQNEIQNIKT